MCLILGKRVQRWIPVGWGKSINADQWYQVGRIQLNDYNQS